MEPRSQNVGGVSGIRPASPSPSNSLVYCLVMWVLCLLFLTGAWSKKLDQPLNVPPNAAFSGGHAEDLSPPDPHEPFNVPPPGGNVDNQIPNGDPPKEHIPIISYDFKPNNGDGSYSFSFETGNGIKAQEEGYLKNEVPEGPGEAVQGIYSYTGPDGVVYTVAYTADENGFVAKGDHLPTPPPVPPEILAALEQNQAEEAAQAQAEAQGTPSPEAQIAYFKQYTPFDYNRFYKRY